MWSVRNFEKIAVLLCQTTNLFSHITYTLCYRYVKFTDMEDRNKIIDECINKIKEMIKPHCSDHTPYIRHL